MEKVWFKSRLSWGDAIDEMTVDEAGHFIKAIYSHVRGSQYEEQIPRSVQILLKPCFAELDADDENRKRISEVRSEAGKCGGRPKANAFDEKQNKAKKANAFDEKQNKAKKADKEREKEREKEKYTDINSDCWISDDEAMEIQNGINDVLLHAEECGFNTAGTVDIFSDLISVFGVQKVHEAINECVESDVRTIRYLRGVLNNKKQEPQPQEESHEFDDVYAFIARGGLNHA